MIIFTPITQIPSEYLEMKGIRQVIIYNLSSYFDAPQLNFLLPSPEYIPENQLTGDCDTPEFDYNYHNYILNNPEAFNQFMNIIIPVNQSPEVLVQILIKYSPYRDAITESLAKLIQQRYGYNTNFVNDLEDFLYVEESTFNIPGLFAFDQDLQRWQAIACDNSPEILGDNYE